MATPAGDASRLFVVEQTGRIRIVDKATGAIHATPFLDLSAVVSTSIERGLLGLAFDPFYSATGRFFVYYTDAVGDIVIARYVRSAADPNQADPTETVLLRIAHAGDQSHNGGMLAFGPDSCLYAATGDGGGEGDPAGNAQNRDVLLGKLLRLDPNTGAPCNNRVSNPFQAGGGAPEVWSYGLRNPWRFSFDRTTGDLYIGDVGQEAREEINVVSTPDSGRGANFGWPVMEGFDCYIDPACVKAGLVAPALDYPHDGGACSVTGGYVYRGGAIPALRGTYFYADFCAGFVRSFRYQGGQVLEQASWPQLSPASRVISSFGEDDAGELYLVTLSGDLFKIVPN